jgi:thiamine biosynthesis lipoprotein
MEGLSRLYDIYNAYEGVNNLYTINEAAGLAPVAADREILDMLLFAREGYYMTDGAVNVALGPVLRVWHGYRERSLYADAALPSEEELRVAAALCDMNDVIIDEGNGTVFLKKAGMSLDVGAVAKSYAARLALDDARAAGMTSALISAGGNIIAVGKPLDGARARWGVGIQDPDLATGNIANVADAVYITDTTVSCSGAYERYYMVDGRRYGHIIDPATLMPAERHKQVAVIHADAGLADVLSTALFILPYEEGALLAEKAGAEALWVGQDGEWRYTEGYAAVSRELSGYSAAD